MSNKLIIASVVITVLYVGAVLLIGFEGFIALVINFSRVALAAAVLIIYIPALSQIFREVPPPRRDYLIAGIILTWMSGLGFAISNEAGRIFQYDTSIFTNSIAGSFSLLLVLGGVFHLLAPGMASAKKNIVAVLIGIVVGVVVVFIAPLFR